MRHNALYFPYISVPNEKWTTQMLLYWDQLASIVPYDHIESPELLDPHMRELVAAGLVEQIVPSHHLNWSQEVWEPFIRFLEPKLPSLTNERITQTAHLHFDKMGHALAQFLEKHDLAKRDHYPWYTVHPRVANWYMAFLAALLGNQTSVNAAPVTNDLRVLSSLNGATLRSGVSAIHKAKARQVALTALLPVLQAERFDPDDLVVFKIEHGALLRAFRTQIEAKVIELGALTNPMDRHDATEAFLFQARAEAAEIVEAMRPRWNAITFNSMFGLTAAGLTAASTDVTTRTLGTAAAAFTLLNAVTTAVRNLRPSKKQMLKRPIAYAVLAQERFGALSAFSRPER